MESPDRKETADDEGLGVGRRNRANWVRAAFGAGEKSSAAMHTSGLTHGEKNPQSSGDKLNVIMFNKHVVGSITVFMLLLWQRTPRCWQKYGVNEILPNVAGVKYHMHVIFNQQQQKTKPGLKYQENRRGSKTISRGADTPHTASYHRGHLCAGDECALNTAAAIHRREVGAL